MSDTSTLGPEEPALGAEEPAQRPDTDLGVVPLPAPEQPHTDPAIVDELRARVEARQAGQSPAPRSSSLIAFRAANAGVDGQQAAQALTLANTSGLGAQFVADNLPTIQSESDRARFADKLTASPVTAAYADQSAVHAAAVKDDIDNLSTLEYWLTGKWQDSPGPAPGAVGPYEQAQTTHKEMVAPPVWQSGLAKFSFGLVGGLLRIKKASVGLTPEEQKRMQQDEEGAAGKVAGAEGSKLRGAGAMAAEALPALLTAPASKPAQATYFTLQAFPGYYQRLGYALDDNGDPRWTDGEAKAIAGSAALATGIGSTLLGSAFLKSIPGAAGKLNGLLGESLVQMFTENPTLAKLAIARGLQAVPHMASGVAMMTASGAVNGSVQALADGHSLASSDGLAQIGHGAAEGAKTGAILSLLALYGAGKRFSSDLERVRRAAGPEVSPAPLGETQPLLVAGEGPTIETTATAEGSPSGGETLIRDLGRATDSGTESLQLDSMVGAAKESGLVKAAPAEAQRLFAAMAQRGQFNTVFIHPDAAKDPDVAAAIDAATEDEGQARALAAATGSSIAVPLEKYLTLIAPDHHDAIREHVKLSPAGMTPQEAQDALPDLQQRMQALQEPFTVEKLNAIAARGDGVLPSEEEINGVLGALRGMGFDAPDVPPVTVAGLGSEAVLPAPLKPPAQHIEAARSVVEAQQIGQIHPAQFALSARQAADRLTAIHAKAIEALARAEAKAQGGIDEATAAAEAARSGAGSIAQGTGMKAASDVPGAGRESLKAGSAALRESLRGQIRAEAASTRATDEVIRAGDTLADVPVLEHARDFSRALAKVSADVSKEMSKALVSLKTLARDNKVRAQLGLADPAFRDVFDSLMEAVGARAPQPAAPRLKVDDLLQTLQARRLPVPFDEQALRDLLDKPQPWKSLKPPEARQAATAAASIVKMALDVNRVPVGADKVALAEAFTRIAAENAGRKDLGAPAATKSARSLVEVVDSGLGAINAWNLKPEVVFQTLGPTMHGIFLKSIEGRNTKQNLQGEILRHFQEHVGELGWMKEKLAGGTSLRMPKIGDAVLAPPPEDNAEAQGSVALPRAMARRYGGDPQEWEKLLASGKSLEDLPTVREIIEKAKSDWDKSRKVQTIPDLKERYNKETVAMAFMNLGSAGNEQRLTSGYNWTGQQVRAEVGKHLTLEQVDQLQAVLDFFEKDVWPKIRTHAEETTGLAPPKVQAQPVTIQFSDGRSKTFRGGYFPASPHPDAIKAADISKAAEAARATVSASFTKERAQQASYPLDLNWSRVGSHLDAVLHYLSYDQPVRDISKVLDNGGVQSIIRHSAGDSNLKNLAEWRDLLAVGRVDNTGFVDQAIRHTLRSRAVTNALSFNLPIAYMQASHIPYAVMAGEIGAANTSLAASRQIPFSTSWKNLRGELTELQFRSTRWADQYRDAISGETALLNGKLGRGIDHVAFLHMEAADAMVSHIIGDASLNDAIDKGMSREDAREYANAKIRLLMPSHNIFEMAPIARSPGIIGALSLFRGLPNVVYNVGYGLFDRSRQALNAAGRPALPDSTVEMEEQPDGQWGMKAKATAFSASNAIRWVASGAILGTLGYFLAGHGKDKEDGRGVKGWAKWGARVAVGSQLESIPGGRDLGQPFVDAAVKGKSVDWAIRELKSGKTVPEMQTIFGLVDDLGKVVSHKDSTPQKIQGAVNATTLLAGIGVRPITAAATNAAGGNSHMRRPRGIFDRLSQTAYPTRTREKTPFNLIEDLVTGTE